MWGEVAHFHCQKVQKILFTNTHFLGFLLKRPQMAGLQRERFSDCASRSQQKDDIWEQNIKCFQSVKKILVWKKCGVADWKFKKFILRCYPLFFKHPLQIWIRDREYTLRFCIFWIIYSCCFIWILKIMKKYKNRKPSKTT